MKNSFDVVVIGAGAAGLMCAITAGKRGRRVLVLDHAETICEKIRISGGGKCNFTHLDAKPENYLSANPHFCKSALARYRPRDFLDMVERHHLRWYEKSAGQLFCADGAGAIVKMLLTEADAAGVEIRTGSTIKNISAEQTNSQRFLLQTQQGSIAAQSVVIATGGLSIPKIGASDFGHRLAQSFGLKLTKRYPALVPLLAREEELEFCRSLSGIATEASVKFGKKVFQENILFTHRGLSGPAILQISSYWHAEQPILIDLLPDMMLEDEIKQRRHDRVLLSTLLGQYLPQRLARAWSERYNLAHPLTELSNKDLTIALQGLHQWNFTPQSSEGYNKAEVTLGGVDTSGLSSTTMEAKAVPGLHFIGEVVDVTGQLGGYNFQWAWASGHAAGMVA